MAPDDPETTVLHIGPELGHFPGRNKGLRLSSNFGLIFNLAVSYRMLGLSITVVRIALSFS